MKHAIPALVGLALLAPCGVARAARVVVLDDGEKIARDLDRELPPSAWPEGDVDLFALRGETVAFQVVVEADAAPVRRIHAAVSTFEPEGGKGTNAGARLPASVEVLTERFVEIRRPSGNERAPGSLAFTPQAAPPPDRFVGFYADALVPGDADAERGQRAALWVDVFVPVDARAGVYRSAIHVSSDGRLLATRPITLRVLDRALPYAAHKTMVYYDPQTLAKRMGDRSAEQSLRAVLHGHHVSAIREVGSASLVDEEADALTGDAFTGERGYVGPGAGVGEGVFAIGAYGSLGEPSAAKVPQILEVTRALARRRVPTTTQSFVYAIDEECRSPWPGRWLELFAPHPELRDVRVGATCGEDPLAQRANLVIAPPADLHPARARFAKAAGKWTWAYNGKRPAAGSMVLDVPATDLRANAWIAARYDIDRWFYWECIYWLDNFGRGGRGGELGFDPFEVAETFHNAHGDFSNHDGILLYPGRQAAPGMVDYGVAAIFPSVRLKNLRRGIQDAGYVALARAIDPDETSFVVKRMIPSALALAGRRPSWPERGAAWLDARRDLARILERGKIEPVDPPPPDGCAVARTAGRGCRGVSACAALALMILAAAVRRRRIRSTIRGGQRDDHGPAASSRSSALRDIAMSDHHPVRKSLVPGLFRPSSTPRSREEAEDLDVSGERRRRQQASTLPPPPGSEDDDLEIVDVTDAVRLPLPPPAPRSVSEVRAVRSSELRAQSDRVRGARRSSRATRTASLLPAATVDEVVANRRHDPRFEEE
jgi:hypothetical protein